jgi:hypothetical protein
MGIKLTYEQSKFQIFFPGYVPDPIKREGMDGRTGSRRIGTREEGERENKKRREGYRKRRDGYGQRPLLELGDIIPHLRKVRAGVKIYTLLSTDFTHVTNMYTLHIYSMKYFTF